MNRKYKIFTFFVLASLFLGIAKQISASDMDSTQYKIQFGNVNIGSQASTSTGYNLGVTMGQDAAGEFNSTGYTVKAGFQYLHSIIPFSFSVSNTHLSFGTLAINTLTNVPTNLTVSFGAAGSYEVAVLEEDPFSTLGGNTIPNTQCDSGDPCTTLTTAKPWTNATRNGFGYNMTGNDIPADFINSTYYRPFPIRSLSDSPVVVMTSTNVGVARQSTMTLTTSVSGTQAAGTYQAVINFIATPSY